MNFNDLCNARESVRDYASRAVEPEKLSAVMEAARLAPSACNRQPWKFIVLESEEARAKAAAVVAKFPWVAGAPVIIVCCIDHSQEWVRGYDGKPHGDIDIAIAAEHICLAASEQGLGTCWVCSFDAAAFIKAFPEQFGTASGESAPGGQSAQGSPSAPGITSAPGTTSAPGITSAPAPQCALEPAILLPLGYPAFEGQRPKIRKPLGEIVEVL